MGRGKSVVSSHESKMYATVYLMVEELSQYRVSIQTLPDILVADKELLPVLNQIKTCSGEYEQQHGLGLSWKIDVPSP